MDYNNVIQLIEDSGFVVAALQIVSLIPETLFELLLISQPYFKRELISF